MVKVNKYNKVIASSWVSGSSILKRFFVTIYEREIFQPSSLGTLFGARLLHKRDCSVFLTF